MFYKEGKDNILRFGDVIKGYIFTELKIKNPILSHPSNGYQYNINFDVPNYSIILTPCCSIEKSIISTTPLKEVLSDFFKNPYFVDDLTRINRKMKPEQTLSPAEWEKLSPDERQERLLEEDEYALLQYFIYDEHELFNQYSRKGRDIRYYMVDFKDVQTIRCSKIKRPKETRPLDEEILNSKQLQLSIQSRKELREKLASFYGRPAKEDLEHDG